MKPRDENLIATTNLLVFLYRARKENSPHLSAEERQLLLIKLEYLDKAGITLPIFHNTLRLLDRKGYLMGVSIIDDDFHKKIKEAVSDRGYEEALSQIPDLNAEFFTPEGKKKILEKLSGITPPQYEFNADGFKNEKVTVKQVLDETRSVLKTHQDNIVSYVMLWPFRSVETLLDKLNDGENFDDIQDSGVWYDPLKYEFHLGNEVVPTSYQGKPNIEHDVLVRLPDFLDDGVIWYDEIDSHKPRSLKDALTKFVRKNEQLEKMFTVHKDRLEFDKLAFE